MQKPDALLRADVPPVMPAAQETTVSSPEAYREQAAEFVRQARQSRDAGAWEAAADAYDAAILRYAECAPIGNENAEAETPVPLLLARAEACREYGEALSRMARYAEAVNIFQEASDVYNLVPGEEARQAGRECARSALAGIAALNAAGHERLTLLIARYERQQRQLALRPETWRRQAECCVHIAQIFARRERPREAVSRYQEALRLYWQASDEPETCLAQAECHHRLGGLFANALSDVPDLSDTTQQAIAHYAQAIALYLSCEPAGQDAQENAALCRLALDDLQRRQAS